MELFYILVEYATAWVNIAPAWTFPYANYGGESHLLLLPETSDIQDIFSTGQALPVAILHILIIFPQADILLILLIFLIPSLMLPPSGKDFYLFIFN